MSFESLEFKEMIADYGITLTYHPPSAQKGWKENGDPIEGAAVDPVQIIGVILPLSDDELRYVEQGTYTSKDRKIITTSELKFGQTVVHKDIPYTVQNLKDYTDYSDVYIYYARWAGNENRSI
ncbi:hypothetical protein [Fictibacillus sp. JL2B1089]|uniref:hypothetical protein n=1 Tax=Fictibacillus sp. JL2B1089 TaxID=3399565 RepID=UPI003A856E27